MYEYNDLFALSCSSTTTTVSDFNGYDVSLPLYTAPPPPPLTLPINEFDAAFPVLKSEFGYSSSSSYGSPCYSQSQQRPSVVQRSMSSHSLQNNRFYHPVFSSLDESRPELFNSGSGSMRKVFSTGDLQGSNMVQHCGQSDSPVSQETCTVDGMNKVGRYTAEERKERIERYRSKRNQRNFNKKIKYACRKTLADSRPRIRGRFARNDEMGEASQAQWNQMSREENEEDEELWMNFFDAFSANLIP